ncbi:Protocatechuate 3,4-dioxygenase beta subunit [Friedmanniella luteola]|uniref:Protocatechuate 3,4-dioxygenase beta subunit n=1 Tax=Friedmanniella luteola TaxID=546871 RepID=A0A1H1T4D0_9ACTN|nr:3,4-dioxygenase subunit beta [Friedmanniella luteola]SDS55030.1 Protocatechuate 3,4-dioxygenase beta subunit [Friedmanniella luteola]
MATVCRGRPSPVGQPTHRHVLGQGQARSLELTDQGLRFDVVTLLSRRNLLRTLGLGATAVTLAACGADVTTAGTPSTSTTLTEIPDETAGPYPGDGSNGPDVLEQSGIVRSDIRSSFGEASGTADGVPLTIELDIKDLANGGAAFAGVAVYLWHCTREGGYSLYSDGITEENFLRGVQIADDQGRVKFTSIFPACYSGRWPHIHVEVYPDRASITDSTRTIATSRIALPQDACTTVYATDGYSSSVTNLAQVSLADDNAFGDDDGATQLGTITGDASDGYAVTLTVGVDTGTEPTGGGRPSGG